MWVGRVVGGWCWVDEHIGGKGERGRLMDSTETLVVEAGYEKNNRNKKDACTVLALWFTRC